MVDVLDESSETGGFERKQKLVRNHSEVHDVGWKGLYKNHMVQAARCSDHPFILRQRLVARKVGAN
jgi:hypothetical protein